MKKRRPEKPVGLEAPAPKLRVALTPPVNLSMSACAGFPRVSHTPTKGKRSQLSGLLSVVVRVRADTGTATSHEASKNTMITGCPRTAFPANVSQFGPSRVIRLRQRGA